jgi:hypothetical protein
LTICAAWIRKVGESEELVFSTDSRLRAFGSWDANPKIFVFSRTDCAICFSGDTVFSYPLMIQVKNSIDANPKTQSRFQRLEVFKGIVVRTMTELVKHKSDYEVPAVDFLFGGYCWFRKAFRLWKIEYDTMKREFVAKLLTNGTWKKGSPPAFFAGDYVDSAKAALTTRLSTKPSFTAHGTLDMEPFEVLVAMLNAPTREMEQHLIGGPPQLLKVYRSLNRVPFGIKWKMKGAVRTTLYGMPVHTTSGFPYPIIDPHTLKTSNVNSFRTAA